jgi:signal transduction histidine kinase
VIVLLGVLVAMHPIVNRIRTLTSEVAESSRRGYGSALSTRGSDEVAELARAFERAGREIRSQLDTQERREQALRAFLENTTHDVMIPLTVLKGHLAGIRDKVDHARPLEVEEISSAITEAHYMASLIQNLAAAAKLEAGEPRIQRTPTHLNDVIARAVGRHLPLARERNVQLESSVPEEPIWADADVTLIEQAVSNIIYNAIRYNHPAGHVAVLLDRMGAGGFVIRVLDDGPGIPDSELARLVERHFRGNEARSRAPGGQGIGLHIAYRVSELHGWRLSLSRSEYGGLEVTLEGK